MRDVLICWMIIALAWSTASLSAAEHWQAGLAKVDITPTEALRLSGYAAREAPASEVADHLYVRALVLSHTDSREYLSAEVATSPMVLISIDSVGVPGTFTVELSKWLQTTHQIPRSHLVVSCTHSHATPHLPGCVDNLFRSPMTDEQLAASQRYLQKLSEATRSAIEAALANRQPAIVELGEGQADFGVNRRVIQQGRWINFGVQPGGQTDPRVPVLRITSTAGKLLGATYQYACHCTTMGSEFNQVSGDWAGLSASQLEAQNPETVFLPIIGCGADINPNPRGSYELAQQHAKTLAKAVESVISNKQLSPLPPAAVVQMGTAGLEPELPTAEQLDEAIKSDSPNRQRWANRMLEIRKAMGRLPESVPMPIHVWVFGDALSWVFLSGEPVVEYQFAIEKELSTQNTWVAGYCDDLFAYVASQAQRAEGGYEVDESMVYFLQPGRWKSGTQSEITSRASSISKQTRGEDQPLDPARGLKSMIVPEGYQVDLLAGEPMIQDPVNIAFGIDGSVWIVEMSDYPLGVEGGGQVKLLRDTDADGRLDRATQFLTGLSYPTSVHPWRDGVLVIAAPNVLFAKDTNGDGVADEQKVMLSGIAAANPQHRANGFEIGLDGRIHFATGDGTRELLSHVNGQTHEVRQRDVAWNPDTGEIEVFVTAQTQFMTARDAFGNWFGNNNYQPMFQYVFESKEVAGKTLETGIINHLLTPGDAPPVYPRSKTSDRFNDMYSRDRYTSACSSMIIRGPGLFPANTKNDSSNPVGLVCEPVHNLVARIQLNPKGAVFAAQRHPADEKFDFLASTDPWARLVRAVNAPDGTVWFLDMYRRIIEHPEWIPTAWQQRVDLRAGAGLGRIYRVFHRDFTPAPIKDLRKEDPVVLLQSPIGAVRDMATQAIVTDQYAAEVMSQLPDRLRAALLKPQSPEVTASLLGVLAGKKWLQDADLVTVLESSSDPQLNRWALKLARRIEAPSQPLVKAISNIPGRELGAAVDLQWLISIQSWPSYPAEVGLTEILTHGTPDRWLSAALNMNNTPKTAEPVLRMMLKVADANAKSLTGLQEQLSTVRKLLLLMPADVREKLVLETLPADAAKKYANQSAWSPSQALLLAAARDAFESETAKQQYALAVERAVEQLLQSTQFKSDSIDNTPSQQTSQPQWLGMLIGNQLLPVAREVEILKQLLRAGDESAKLAVERSRFVSSDDVATELLKAWKGLQSPEQSTAAGILISRPTWRVKMVEALERGEVKASQLPAAVIQSLISQSDRNLRSRSIAVFGQPSPRQSIVSEYMKQMPNPNTDGDSLAGEKLYRDHCAVCHTSQNGKPSIGPAIDNLAHWNNGQWIIAVMDPNQAIEEKYKQTTILTKDDQVFSGLLLESGDDELRIVGSDGNRRTVAVSEVQQQKRSDTSLMPEGFESKLSPQQLADLVKYLKSK